MKIYTQKIENCSACPSCGYDINITRLQCERMNNKFIVWMGRDDEDTILADWCPLEEINDNTKIKKYQK